MSAIAIKFIAKIYLIAKFNGYCVIYDNIYVSAAAATCAHTRTIYIHSNMY